MASRRLSSLIPSKQAIAFDSNTTDETRLANLGYEQELKRNFSLIGMIGFSFSIVTCWTALGGVLVVGIESGGPPVMVWSWLGVCALTLCIAYSFAEMCSV
jgi:choline transport protein